MGITRDVQAKMRVTKKTSHSWGSEKEMAIDVELQPVFSDDPGDPNYSFSKATPTGEVRLTITNDAAFDAFKVGKQYLITFTEV